MTLFELGFKNLTGQVGMRLGRAGEQSCCPATFPRCLTLPREAATPSGTPLTHKFRESVCPDPVGAKRYLRGKDPKEGIINLHFWVLENRTSRKEGPEEPG